MAFELERRGTYEAAAEAYRRVLAHRPGDVSALLGLERVLLPLNRSVEILPDVHAALYRPRQHDVKKFCTDPACLTLSRDPQLERNRTSTQWRGGHEQPGSDPACRPG
jgi:hypothetical protein